MKIKINDIPESGFQIDAEADTAGWLKGVLTEIFKPEHLLEGDGGRLNLQLFRNKTDVSIIGGIILKFHPACDRCLIPFLKQQQITIQQVMMPAHGGPRGEKEADDEGVGFYYDNEIDIDNVVKEHILLSQQMVNVCNDNCKGLCPRCGKNLNKGPCRCKKKPAKKASPFAVLKKIGT